jgi:hypothetical protein
MKRNLCFAVSLAGLLLAGCASGLSVNDRVLIIGDTAYIDGHAVPKAEYEKAEANGTLNQLAAQLDSKTVGPARVAGGAGTAPSQVAVAPAAPAIAGPHAAICDSQGVYDVYPGDSALFSCSAGLGNRTRTQLLAQGWKIDLMEKVPAGGGRYAYKLVLSR